MIITIAGSLGSGKSTVAKLIAKQLNYKHYSTGDFMREMALARNISLLELSKIAESDPSIDKSLDERQIRLGKEDDNLVIDSRLGFHFIPRSIKVLMKVDDKEGARRILQRMSESSSLHKSSDRENKDFETTYKNLKTRRASEDNRFKAIYGIDQSDEKRFDIVVDSTHKNPEMIAEEIIAFVKKNKFRFS